MTDNPRVDTVPSSGNGRPHWRETLFFWISVRLALLALVFMLIQVLMVVRMYATNTTELDQLLISAEADRIATQLPSATSTSPTIQALQSNVMAPGTRRSFIVHERSGRVIARYDDGPLVMEDTPPLSFLVLRTQRKSWDERFLLTGTRRVEVDGRTLWITVAIAGSGFRLFIPVIFNEILFHVLFPLVALSLMLLAFNFSVVRNALKPLRAAIVAIEQIDAKQTSTRISIPSSSWEAQALTHAVNHMLERLESTLRTLNDFAGHAAHELRTPLAILTLSIRRLPDQAARSVLLDDVQRMTRLVDQMLDMARAAALDIPADARADLGEIARDVAAAVTPLTYARGRSIAYYDNGPVTVHGDADAITRALRNVIDNAIAHTPPGTSVTVTGGPGPVLSVRDHGPGIPAGEREKVLGRFYRISNDGHEGAGIGLAIVLAIMQAHNGAIEIQDADNGGTLVTLRFAG
ncbi:ATP-binding protein [Klebsiella pneumoniae]|uniref:sensor histidine kinase n=1 Tax=Enterobacteriaceae TaxID=543 RepID=UPI0020CD7E17|nr:MULTISPECIES: ATP-binding protein [Enterobacteriaceae]MCQ0556585.1 ATP-binding protein [Klebsiella pneumoniae]MDA4308532.1 ATP-binding protein [Escherichia coli]MDA4425801.1 ATP-binding protein [Escherichia coli]MDA4435194.1 ATP-binding protein [Escherichia coli]